MFGTPEGRTAGDTQTPTHKVFGRLGIEYTPQSLTPKDPGMSFLGLPLQSYSRDGMFRPSILIDREGSGFLVNMEAENDGKSKFGSSPFPADFQVNQP